MLYVGNIVLCVSMLWILCYICGLLCMSSCVACYVCYACSVYHIMLHGVRCVYAAYCVYCMIVDPSMLCTLQCVRCCVNAGYCFHFTLLYFACCLYHSFRVKQVHPLCCVHRYMFIAPFICRILRKSYHIFLLWAIFTHNLLSLFSLSLAIRPPRCGLVGAFSKRTHPHMFCVMML